MSLRDDLSLFTPRLRRYAQALASATPSQSEAADALVHRTLMHALQIGALNPRSDMTVWLYSLLTQFHRDAENRLHGATAAGESQSLQRSGLSDNAIGHGHVVIEGLGTGLASLSLEEREALLLVVLEGFSYGQASHILRISRAMLITRLAHARATLSNVLATHSHHQLQTRRPPYLRLIK